MYGPLNVKNLTITTENQINRRYEDGLKWNVAIMR